jgi:hypothetical protein
MTINKDNNDDEEDSIFTCFNEHHLSSLALMFERINNIKNVEVEQFKIEQKPSLKWCNVISAHVYQLLVKEFFKLLTMTFGKKCIEEQV